MLEELLPGGITDPGQKLIIRPTKPLDRHLSPVRVLSDLFDLKDLEPVHKIAGDAQAGKAVLASPITVMFIAHFWRADFLRVFGERFFACLIERQGQGGRLVIQSRKLLCFKEVHKTCHRFLDPVLEYARHGGLLHPIRVRNFDTSLPFGQGSLDEPCPDVPRPPEVPRHQPGRQAGHARHLPSQAAPGVRLCGRSMAS